jgi:hypothetical protein
MNIERLPGDPRAAQNFSWDALLDEPGTPNAPKAPSPERPSPSASDSQAQARLQRLSQRLLQHAPGIAAAAVLVPLLLLGTRSFFARPLALPSPSALESLDPQVDLDLLRLERRLQGATDIESVELRLLAQHWLNERARLGAD